MKDTNSSKDFIIFYPIIIALFPLLYITSRRKFEISKWSTVMEIVAIFFALLVGSILFYLLIKHLVKDRLKAGLIAGIILAVFFYFEHLGGFLKWLSWKPAPDWLVATLQIVLMTAGVIAVLRTKRNLENVTKIVQFTVLVFFIVSAYKPAEYTYRYITKTRKQLKQLATYHEREAQDLIALGKNPAHPIKGKPDIYYIILDRYGSSPNLKEFYQLDNTDFVDYLSNRGFYIAHGSRNNYPVTGLSLASSLNMKYLDFIPQLFPNKPEDYRVAYYLIEHNLTAQFLKSQGYKYIYMGSYWEPTSYSSEADENIFWPPLKRKYLDNLIDLTPLKLLADKYLAWNSGYDHWRRENSKFETISRIPFRSEPTFVFAHVLIPHNPYVYDGNGRYITNKENAGKSEKEKYREQVKCINKKIKWLVEKLQERSETPPIIIVQGDEGPYPQGYKKNLDHLLKMSTSDKKIKVGVLNAYYLPGFDTRKLYPTITPVNTFRLVLNHYFGVNLSMLPDKSHLFNRWQKMYDFTDITDQVRDTRYQELIKHYQNKHDGTRNYDWETQW